MERCSLGINGWMFPFCWHLSNSAAEFQRGKSGRVGKNTLWYFGCSEENSNRFGQCKDRIVGLKSCSVYSLSCKRPLLGTQSLGGAGRMAQEKIGKNFQGKLILRSFPCLGYAHVHPSCLTHVSSQPPSMSSALFLHLHERKVYP